MVSFDDNIVQCGVVSSLDCTVAYCIVAAWWAVKLYGVELSKSNSEVIEVGIYIRIVRMRPYTAMSHCATGGKFPGRYFSITC
jgi:hypothetical protein